jgi:hypothetical protein
LKKALNENLRWRGSPQSQKQSEIRNGGFFGKFSQGVEKVR